MPAPKRARTTKRVAKGTTSSELTPSSNSVNPVPTKSDNVPNYSETTTAVELQEQQETPQTQIPVQPIDLSPENQIQIGQNTNINIDVAKPGDLGNDAQTATAEQKQHTMTKVEPAKISQLTTAERLALRTNKFKTTVSDKARLTLRAQKFGLVPSSAAVAAVKAFSAETKIKIPSQAESFVKVVDPEALKRRAERFGSVTESARLEARKARFSSTPISKT